MYDMSAVGYHMERWWAVRNIGCSDSNADNDLVIMYDSVEASLVVTTADSSSALKDVNHVDFMDCYDNMMYTEWESYCS